MNIPAIFSFLFATVPAFAQTSSSDELSRLLAGDGAVGHIHGSVSDLSQYVFSFRGSGDFFSTEHFPLISRDSEIKKVLATTRRHDEVRVWGSLVANSSPVPHIAVSKIQVLGTQPELAPTPYAYRGDLSELAIEGSLIATVHAIGNNGRMLVIEYKDRVIPLPVPHGDLTQNLYRNDGLSVSYIKRENPHRPPHLSLNLASPTPLSRIFEIGSEHGKLVTRIGRLVKFPKSPQVRFDVFALEWNLVLQHEGRSESYPLYHTLVNFEDSAAFQAVREKLASAWIRHHPQDSGAINGRNKLVSDKLWVQATGTYNLVDAKQANPQIIVSSPNSIELSVRE